MNTEITGYYKSSYIKERKDRNTGETVQGDLIVQIEQEIHLENNQIKFESYDIPVDSEHVKLYQSKKRGDIIKVPCNIYAQAVNANFATLGIGKAK